MIARWKALGGVGLAMIVLALPGRVEAADTRPTQAHLQAGEHGQAVLLSRLNECYAVAPAHVVGSEIFATLTGASAEAPIGDGDVLQTFGYDLSVLRVTGDLARRCGGPIASVSGLDRILSRETRAAVSSVNADGSLSRRAVTVTDVGLLHLRIRPSGASDQLFKGLSGSPVLMGDQTIGLLMSVDAETGEGTVLRFDRAVETLRPFFGLAAASPTGTKQVARDDRPGDPNGLALRVASWSAPPLNADSRAANLAMADAVWLTRPTGFPIEIVLELPGEQAHTVDSLRMLGSGIEPRTRLVRDFEILVSSAAEAGRRGWLSVQSGTFFQNDTEKEIRFAPVRARRIMLRVYSHWGDPEAVGLAAIEVPAPR